MSQSSGFLLVVVGLLLLFVVISGKYEVFERFVYDLFDIGGGSSQPTSSDKQAAVEKGISDIFTSQAKVQADIKAKQQAIQDAIRQSQDIVNQAKQMGIRTY